MKIYYVILLSAISINIFWTHGEGIERTDEFGFVQLNNMLNSCRESLLIPFSDDEQTVDERQLMNWMDNLWRQMVLTYNDTYEEDDSLVSTCIDDIERVRALMEGRIIP
ncbi:uncharacterized protein LOC106639371 [Copidosoma floridanum]|uniref:uncharacterized protein LOC106639371 n=1 Tax=Copidosoma floridanum TaxID=29053 RepID=UPI0006C998E8|nr:uncharacterized protein LOC106639371 [Copidosoma floridanum]